MRAFREQFAHEAKQAGIGRLWFREESSRGHSAEVFCGETDRVDLFEETTLYIEGEVKGLRGAAFAEALDPAGIPPLVETIIATAKANGEPFAPRAIRPGHGARSSPAEAFEPPELSLILQRLQAADARMRREEPLLAAATLSFYVREKTVRLANEAGDEMADHMHSLGFYVNALAKRDGLAQTAMGHMLAASGGFAPEGLALRCAGEAAALLGAAPCKSGTYSAVLRGDVLSALLGAFLPVFFAERAQTGMSPAKGRLGQTVGAPCVTLREDPSGLVHRTFDDEGTPTAAKNIIENGVLRTLLYTGPSAAKEGRASTGNAFQPDNRSAAATAATNVLLCPGEKTPEELLRTLGDGLYITECGGVFAGVNPGSGDFSLISKGFLVQGGRLARPVAQFTIGGNLFRLLSGIAEVGNDPAGTDDPALNFVQAPSVLVQGLSVSGA